MGKRNAIAMQNVDAIQSVITADVILMYLVIVKVTPVVVLNTIGLKITLAAMSIGSNYTLNNWR